MSDDVETLEPTVPATERSPLLRARTLAVNLVTTVRLSNALVSARRPVDLAGLDAAIGLLCAKVLDLEPTEGRMLLAELVAVLDELAVLAHTLADHARPSG